jgi:ribosomal protein L13E
LGTDIDGEAASDYSGTSVSLSSDGTTVAIGAYYNDGSNGTSSGHVRVYKYDTDSTSWSQMGGDIDGEAASDYSGTSVSLSSNGTTVAIGADYNDGTNGSDSGHVRVYKYNGTAWSQMGTDIDGEAANDLSGYSVSLSDDGTTVAIGAYRNDGTNGSDSGHVRVYQYNGTAWSQLGTDIDGEAASDQSGYSVSLSSDGKIVAIGARSNDGNGTNSGHVRVYQYDGSAWTQLGQDIDGEAAGDQSGTSVSLSSDGTIMAIGATDNDGNTGNSDDNRGHVRVYKLDTPQLKTLGYTASDLATVGFDASQLKNYGFDADALNAPNFDVSQLIAGGYTLTDLKNRGANAAELHEVGYSFDQLRQAGFSAVDCRNGGMSNSELPTSGFTVKQLREGGLSAIRMKSAGYSAKQLYDNGYPVPHLFQADYSASEIRLAGVNALQARFGGISNREMKTAGYTVKEYKAASYQASRMKKAGYTREELKGIYSEGELDAAGY